MKIDSETLRKITHLARLEYKEDKEDEMLRSLSEILTWVETLNEVDTSEVEILKSMSQEVNALRDDITETPLPRSQGLLNAPQKNSEYFIVPKVIE